MVDYWSLTSDIDSLTLFIWCCIVHCQYTTCHNFFVMFQRVLPSSQSSWPWLSQKLERLCGPAKPAQVHDKTSEMTWMANHRWSALTFFPKGNPATITSSSKDTSSLETGNTLSELVGNRKDGLQLECGRELFVSPAGNEVASSYGTLPRTNLANAWDRKVFMKTNN